VYRQLQLYLDRFVIRTDLTGTPTETYQFGLGDLGKLEHLAVLRAVFADPTALRPRQTTATVTKEAARFAILAERLRGRGWNRTKRRTSLCNCRPATSASEQLGPPIRPARKRPRRDTRPT
jgi:hypothetical protein